MPGPGVFGQKHWNHEFALLLSPSLMWMRCPCPLRARATIRLSHTIRQDVIGLYNMRFLWSAPIANDRIRYRRTTKSDGGSRPSVPFPTTGANPWSTYAALPKESHHCSGYLGGWATPWSAEEMLDEQRQRVDIPAHARTAHKGLQQKRLEKDLCWIVPHVPSRWPRQVRKKRQRSDSSCV